MRLAGQLTLPLTVQRFPRPSGRGSIAACRRDWHHREPVQLPPAIRPGLHCGKWHCGSGRLRRSASPGHQAGAPLRQGVGKRGHPGRQRLPPAIRPGLHCGASLIASASYSSRSFPRPSGRGSIAAGQAYTLRQVGANLPPAIRPGLHCGPRLGVEELTNEHLPPAIRPGLHCGRRCLDRSRNISPYFPRPSGRGSIAASRGR